MPFRLIIFVLCFNYLLSDGASPILKCCPDGQVLQERNGAFNCFEHKNELYSNKIKSDGEIHIPKCSDGDIAREVMELNATVITGDQTCVDLEVYLDDENDELQQHSNLYCNNSLPEATREKETVYEIFKCCGYGRTYNLHTRECFDGNTIINNFTDGLLSDVSFTYIISNNPPECEEDDEVVVEYHSHDYSMSIHDGNLQLISVMENKTLNIGKYCLEKTTIETTKKAPILNVRPLNQPKVMVRTCASRDICNEIPCLRKCCLDFEKLIDNSCQPHDFSIIPRLHSNASRTEIEAIDYSKIGFFHARLACSLVSLNPNQQHYDKHIIEDSKGHLIYLNHPTLNMIPHDEYCLEYNEDDQELVARVCQAEAHFVLKSEIALGVLALFSAFFIFLTLLIYIILPKLRDIHGKILISYLVCLFFGYVALGVIKLFAHEIENCTHLSYFFYFAFIASFSWLNIKCFDIYYTVRSVHVSNSSRASVSKRFIYYSCHAWFIPVFLTGLTKLIDTYKLVNEDMLPKLGNPGVYCLFGNSSGTANILYFVTPIGMIIIANTILFILTVRRFNLVKSAVKQTRKSSVSAKGESYEYSENKAIFIINTKLFIVMGVLWTCEVLSSFFPNPKWFWDIFDYLNMMQGLFVFIIFALKKRVIESLFIQLGIRKKEPNSNELTCRTTMMNRISKNQESIELQRMSSIEETEPALQPQS